MSSPTKPVVADSPIRNSGRTQLTNTRASIEHIISDNVVHAVEMDYYVKLARASFDKLKWKEIATLERDGTKTDIGNALEAVLDLARRDEQSRTGLREPEFYGPTVRLCNLISLAVFDALKDSRPLDERDVACIFASNADRYPPGDILNLRYRPDYHGFFGARAELEFAISQAIYNRTVCWPEIGWVGEQKKRLGSGRGQLKSYVMATKRSRPDIPTVHGFVLHKGKIQLTQGNASGMWCSSAEPVGNINAWIALVVLLYQSYADRDRKLVFNAQQQEFVRWDFTESAPAATLETDAASVAAAVTASAATAPPQDPLVLTPFYASHAPGRVTYASYQVASGPVSQAEAAEAFYTAEVKGFWKTAWQQKSPEGRLNERQLLDRLHAGGAWLPGLVRPYPETDGHRLQIPTPNDIVQRARHEVDRRAQVPESHEDTAEDQEVVPAGDPDADLKSNQATEESGASSGYTSGCAEDEYSEDVIVDESVEHEDTESFFTSMSATPLPVVDRVQEIVHLASIGEPISQCSTPRELLEAIYDLLQVHIHMWDEGVLHRDVSWFNALVKPRHYIGNGDQMKPQPCIRRILHGLGPADDPSETASDAEFAPTVLLTDLDHAIERDRLTTGSDNGRDRTGTPMFIACELSNHEACRYKSVDRSDLRDLRNQLSLVDKHDGATEALRRAFPDDNGQFMAIFEQVAEREHSRVDRAPLSERPVHRPRHDAESIYWVLLWALARARPRGSAPETDEARLKEAATFADCLLKHTVGTEKTRLHYITSPDDLERLLHPELAEFEPLLHAMATYLSIPWHIYHEVNDDHVHIAFRRLILGFLLSRKPEVLTALRLVLDTQTPRRFNVSQETTTERMISPLSGSQSSVGGSGRASLLDFMPPPQGPSKGKGPADVVPNESPPLLSAGPAPSTSHGGDLQSGASASSTASKKRKLADTTAESAKKRAKVAHGASSSKTQRVHLTKSERARKATKYQHDLHFDSRSAFALRLKVWKDRGLWFSK